MRIGVIGYGWTGSSALVNFLENNSEYYLYPGELSFMWDSGGVIDLYRYLTEDFSTYSISRKLTEFEELIKVCSKKRNLLNPNGTNSPHLIEFKNTLFKKLSVDYVEFSQRNLVFTRSKFDYVLFKVKDLIKRRQYPWMSHLDKREVLAVFRESLNHLFKVINPNNYYMILDQPCYVDQVDLAMDLLQLDYTYVVSRDEVRTLKDMVNNSSMYGVIRNEDKRNKCFSASMDYLLSLELSNSVRIIAFEEFVHLGQFDLQQLFPFMTSDDLVECISRFNWEYSRSNV